MPALVPTTSRIAGQVATESTSGLLSLEVSEDSKGPKVGGLEGVLMHGGRCRVNGSEESGTGLLVTMAVKTITGCAATSKV